MASKKANHLSSRIIAACCSDRGRVRRNNEDNYWFDGEHMDAGSDGSGGILCAEYDRSQLSSGNDIFFAVFDGVGGAQYGEQASMIAAAAAGHFLSTFEASSDDTRSFVETMYRSMNQAVLRGRESLCAHDICTTAVSLLFHNDSVWCSNAGDSRCYMFSGGELIRMSTDHNNAQAFSLLGITGVKPMLTQYLGMDPSEFEFCPSHTELSADPGTTFLLCSDGLTDMVSEERILEVLDSGNTPSESVRILRDEALANGGRDNITIIAVLLQ